MRRPERRGRFQPGSIQAAAPWRTVTETWEEAENRAYDGLMTGGAADAIVVGAGVIGLTTGICLAEAGLRVRIRTAELPGQTTSAAAVAMAAREGPAGSSPGFEACTPDELPDGFSHGFWATLPLVELPRYLGYVADRFETLGSWGCAREALALLLQGRRGFGAEAGLDYFDATFCGAPAWPQTAGQHVPFGRP
jgi:hypothetical protein